ncbi:MAG: response regulator [Cyanophyceae cyanobacterium]
MPSKILIVEDEPEIARIIRITLEREGFSCHDCRDGIAALQAYREQQPDVIILDLMLPGIDGLEVCARLRRQPETKDPYVLMLTARGEAIDRVVGLSTGADDYLVKPFIAEELVARVRALLRRSLRQIEPENLIYQTQHFQVNASQGIAFHRSTSEEEPLKLTVLEFKLLSTFVSQPQQVWSRTQLIDKLWGDDFFGDDRVIDIHVERLRKKIELDPAHPTFIKTIIGVGYKFEDKKA